MAKNRNKKKPNGAVSMDTAENAVSNLPEAMDTPQSGAHDPAAGALKRTMKKGRPMKRSKNFRKTKAIAKAISQSEKSMEKILKNEIKTSRTQSAKMLYEFHVPRHLDKFQPCILKVAIT